MTFEAVVDLATLDGAAGIRINGEARYDRAGCSVASAGDVNGDGIEDLIIGAWGAGPNGAYSGAAYVVFGRAAGLPAVLDLSALDGTNGFKLNGAASRDRAGLSVDSAGDLNGDGIDDLVVGAFTASPGGVLYAGATYVVYGTDTGFAASLELADLDGTNGFRLHSTAYFDQAGYAVSRAGDINGDGFDDLLIGARTFETPGGGYYAGATFVMFGTDAGVAADIDLADLDGTNGFRIDGAAYDFAGLSIGAAGDVNGDGLGDLIIGARGAGPSDAGAAFVVFGSDAGFAAAMALADVDGTNGFRIDGQGLGGAVASAGDINGDGFADLIVGSQAAAAGGMYAGAAYVVFGAATFGADVDIADLDGTGGFRILGQTAGDRLGGAVAPAGDVNGDGLDDLIVGAHNAQPDGRFVAGASYVVYGRQRGFAADLDLASLDGTNGFQLIGAERDVSGRSVASGDINNDGLSDLIIGAHHAGGAVNAGAVYVVYGRAQQFDLTGAAGDDALRGGMLADHLIGMGGRDRLEGRQGDDRLEGGDMGDTLLGGDGADDLAGGAGGDVLYGEAGDDALDGGEAGDKLFGGLGVDVLSGGLGADRLDGGDGGDVLSGDTDNDLLDGGLGADAMSGGTGNDIYLVDDAGDTTVEAAGEGFDIVRTALDGWVLGANLEGLELQGGADLDGSGNGGANNLQGNAGSNRLDGAGGVDTLNGNDGDDIIVGGVGNDLLRGGMGADSFVVAHAFGPVLETDQVYDFSAAEGDILDLSDAFGGTISLVSAFGKQAGQMTLTFAGGLTTLRLDTTGDGKVDYQMKINGDVTGESGDWLL